ncbi:MAG: substrate-binding domain-containing protein [Eubacteriales bacterium]|nr:substrate-binding domain-containing protein [Eubacteriales bacterium]
MKRRDRQGIKRCIRKGSICLLLCSFLLSACGQTQEIQTEVKASSAEKSDAPVIGFIFDSFVIERWEKDRDIFTSTAKELGAEVVVSNANGDAKEQAALLERMIEDKIDVIAIVPIDSTTLVEPIARAQRAGIKIISYDRIINNAGTDLYISFDNEMVGQYMADCLNEKLPNGGKYLYITGPDTDNNVQMVQDGFDREIQVHFQLLDRYGCSNWNDEEAYTYLTEHADLLRQADAVVCGNDSIAGQAVRVLAENRLAGSVIVTGQDADLEACQRIAEGTQTMTAYKPIEQLARQAAIEAVRMAKGEEREGAIRTFNDGSESVPYIAFPPEMVKQDNLKDTVIADGFYMEDDIFNR